MSGARSQVDCQDRRGRLCIKTTWVPYKSDRMRFVVFVSGIGQVFDVVVVVVATPGTGWAVDVVDSSFG